MGKIFESFPTRIDRKRKFLEIALEFAKQGTCLRRNYGAIIVDQNNHIISTGYTGSPSRMKDCLEIGKCWRKEHNIPSGSNYEKCRSVHAEQNAMLQAGRQARGCDMYVAGFDVDKNEVSPMMPCFLCSKMAVNAGIRNILILREKDYIEVPTKEVYEFRAKEIFEE